ncbi:MAG TPA: protein phosphatase 2C domain-containing protein, partial [Kofleriaceae bacterium]|nr:protein phosphatase 2C domain-containing protein [Kofleriaceae bacterium]
MSSSIVAAAVTDVGKVREHNEDNHFIDAEAGVFIVCDGMGGHAAGEVASALAVKEVRSRWLSDVVENTISIWLNKPSPESRLAVLGALQTAVALAHTAIVNEARRDIKKKGMGTTIVAVRVIGGDAFFAHAGDSRAYLVRDGIAMQVTEDHTLLARLLAAGIDVDTSGDGARFRSMLTNALGIGEECRVSTFVLPLADGDRFLLCSDGISEYVPEKEVGEILSGQASPARAAQKLVDTALARGGADNATAVVVRVLEAGTSASSAAMRQAELAAIAACPWL